MSFPLFYRLTIASKITLESSPFHSLSVSVDFQEWVVKESPECSG